VRTVRTNAVGRLDMDARTTRRTRASALSVTLLVALFLSIVAPLHAGAGEITRRERFHRLTNEVRVDRDRERLGFVDRLARYAKRHSRAMAGRGYLFHSDAATLQSVLAPYDWSIGGENVGVGSDVEAIQNAFMRSKPHRRNILRTRYDHMAVGIVRQDDRLWVTVIFYG
jgi:uncharacterized protein YkwD